MERGSGIYNRDFKNYRYLCRLCHTKRDYYKHFKDMSDRICSACGSNETYIRRDGTMNWNHVDGGLLCGRCYTRYRRSGKKPSNDTPADGELTKKKRRFSIKK
jgi:hypothetical protein